MVRLNKVKLVLQEKEKRVAENGDMQTRSASFNKEMNEGKDEQHEYTLDGSVDIRGRPAAKGKTGGWVGGVLVLAAAIANGFVSLGRQCLVLLSVSTYLFLLKPSGCGGEGEHFLCGPHSSMETGVFYVSVYLIALGNGGYQPNIATFGADQFDEKDVDESHSKVSFFSYFYLALNLGSLFSNTFLDYFEDKGMWALGFWVSAGSAAVALLLFLCGSSRYRHFKPIGNPLSRVCQVVVAASRKWRMKMPTNGGDDLYEVEEKQVSAAHGSRRTLHTEGFRFLDRAAVIDPENDFRIQEGKSGGCRRDPWRLCPITQVEELKCVLRLIPIWLTTILYSVVFTQMASLFVEQGAAMDGTVAGFRIPPASMSAFDIVSVAAFILFYRRLLNPLVSRLRKDPRGLTELQRMGAGLILAIMATASAGTVEVKRLRNVCRDCDDDSSLSILWQIPQYALIGASEVFMYVGQLEFFNGQAPDGLKSFGSALCMTSISLGNYVSSLLVTAVMEITAKGDRPGWIPANLNRGHMDRFYFLLASLTAADFLVFVACARWYRRIKLEESDEDDDDDDNCNA
ncbi:hypothetical protein BHM03_00055321 [Ensete ventricosum]|nr:hypothetical protein BHM03_00055321 [Ensete ventricosum]